MAAEMILQQAVLIDQLQWDERFREELVSQLLNDTEKLDARYFEKVARIGIDLNVSRVAVVVTASEPSMFLEVIREQLGKEDLYVLRPDHLVLLKAITVKESKWNHVQLVHKLKKWVAAVEKYKGVRCKIGIGNYHPDVKGISQSYEEARLTANVGEKMDPQAIVYIYEHYKLPVFLAKASEA